jgi:hypothetical protein
VEGSLKPISTTSRNALREVDRERKRERDNRK